MAEEDLSAGVRDTVASLRAVRGACPEGAALVQYHALAAPVQQAHPIHEHVQVCSRCQLVLLHLEAPQTIGSRRPAWVLPVAAAIALAVLAPFVYRGMNPGPPPPDTVRGTDVQPIAPIGNVRELHEFRWQSPIDAAQYRVRVFRGAAEVWSATSGVTRLESAAAPLEPNVEYAWQVEALDSEGVVRLRSPRQSFTVVPQ